MPQRVPSIPGRQDQRMLAVQNRTDLSADQGKYGLRYGQYTNFSIPSSYVGEVIPAYAVMRIIDVQPITDADGQPTGDVAWRVCLPDDVSQEFQVRALHIFNGPSPIPLGMYGLGTMDLPTEALVDPGTFGQFYGGVLNAIPYSTVTGGIFAAVMSGSWALVEMDWAPPPPEGGGAAESPDNLCIIVSNSYDPDPSNPGKFIPSVSRYWVADGWTLL